MTDHNPLVSVIIPAYNRADLIGETLESVMAQTYPYWECIVVDDHSTDHTWDVLNEYCLKDNRIKCFKRPASKPKGANACRNFGLSISKGEYIQFIDSDDIIINEKLKIQTKEFMLNNQSKQACILPSIRISVINMEIKYQGLFGKKIKPKNCISIIEELITMDVKWDISGPLWKKTCIENDPFDEQLFAAQDWLFHIKQVIKLNCDQFIFLEEGHGTLIRVDNESISRSKNLFLSRLIGNAQARIIAVAILHTKNQPDKLVSICLYETFKYIRKIIRHQKKIHPVVKQFREISFRSNKKIWIKLIIFILKIKLGIEKRQQI